MTEPTTEPAPTEADPSGGKPPIAAAVVVRSGRVLMVRRRVAEGTLQWQFPAGAVETGETPQEAAERETAEETGLIVVAVKLLGERVHPATGRSMSYTACEVVDGEATIADPDELDAVTWATLSDLTQLVPSGLYEPVQAFLDGVLDN